MRGRSNAFHIIVLMACVCIAACDGRKETRFAKLDAVKSGVTFVNVIEESPSINILSYEYTYNGGGVAAADFNNDGFCDLYFSGNTVSNRLFLNQGDLRFEDVTADAGVGGRELWKTGVAAADINGDGWMDLYVCYSGPDVGQSFSNQLFINNGPRADGVPTFTEAAERFGIDAPGTLSTQATFFDYDRDGDLDMFLVNHGDHFYSPFINTNQLRNTRHPRFGNRLYRNDMIVADGVDAQPGDHFTEVSQEAGIHGGGLNFGLGVSVSDVNADGWPDIFVTNDYEEQDFLYLNNGDGTFSDATKESFGHFSRNGMGSDIADFNNDLRPDLIEVDMWPQDNYRQKLLRGPDDFNRYQLMVDSGFHYQQMRNTLQMNAGVYENGTPVFCEVGRMAGVFATDWSWAPLFVDLDNDGYKDLFVTNGYLRDFTSMDFLKYTVEQERRKAKAAGGELEIYALVSKMPSTKTADYVFRNNGDLTFSDCTSSWGLHEPNLSFGAAYADLDNDGDLELITNNTNETAAIWVNHSPKTDSTNFIRVRLEGQSANSNGVGARVVVTGEVARYVQEQFPTRGYQSSVDPVLHFGLGRNKIVDITVTWPDGSLSQLRDVEANQLVTLTHDAAAEPLPETGADSPRIFKDVTSERGIDFTHKENRFVDFDREPLIPYQLSRQGPALARGDVNQDGTDDFFIGGALGQASMLFMADHKGRFSPAQSQPWQAEAECEAVAAVFFDADTDGDPDLYVVTGGNEHPMGSPMLNDRLYLNDGKGNFTKAPESSVSSAMSNGSCAAAADYDKDGDVDLFVGGRVQTGRFPVAAASVMLRNETDRKTGAVRLIPAAEDANGIPSDLGMVTDAIWCDFNNDTWPDLVVAGHWMPVRFFENKKGKLWEVEAPALKNHRGFWNRIIPVDVDSDGDMDFVAGNAGLNQQWKISPDQPLVLYQGDFNGDGRIDPIICYTSVKGVAYPVASRDELILQMNGMRRKFQTYAQYAEATVADIIDPGAMRSARRLTVEEVRSMVIKNNGNGDFSLHPLPALAQLSCVNGIIPRDFNGDGHMDLLVSGNFFPWRTEFGPDDASRGLLLAGDGEGGWTPQTWHETGFVADGDVRNMVWLKTPGAGGAVLLSRNDGALAIFETLEH